MSDKQDTREINAIPPEYLQKCKDPNFCRKNLSKISFFV